MADHTVGGAGGVGFRITRIWAFVADHGGGDEGIVAMNSPNGWLPLVAADRERLDQLRPLAERAVRASGKPVHLVRFDTRTVEETLSPGGPART